MTEKEAYNIASKRVYVYMTRLYIEDECEKRNIRITKNRSTMEKRLIKAYVKELVEKK